MKVIAKTNISAYPLLSRGKVRDIYAIGADTLLIVTTDRMSAFDVNMAEPVPWKGVILNQLTLFWMQKFDRIVPNHILASEVRDFPKALAPWADELEGRSVLARRAKALPVECVVRGYLAGSGWAAYQKTGKVLGHELPAGLKEAAKLDPPLFTPTTKAEIGHDESISFGEMAALCGDGTAEQARLLSLDIYNAGRAYAAEKGIIVADTKFEFGFINDTLHIIDEVLTPDSSRFWDEAAYEPGHSQESFDKQYLRDWLNAQHWDHKPPAPALPRKVIEATERRYVEAYEKLTGLRFEAPAAH